MHPEILSIALFWFVTAYTPGPNNVVASYSGVNFGITKTIPHILGVTLGFTSLVLFLTIGLLPLIFHAIGVDTTLNSILTESFGESSPFGKFQEYSFSYLLSLPICK